MKTLTIIFIPLTLALFRPIICKANTQVCKDNICFNTTIDSPKMSLRGVSIFEYLFFDVYVAAFYTEEPLRNGLSIFDPNKSSRLELHYLTKINKESFILSTEELIKKNKDINYTIVEPKFVNVFNAYEDVEKGDSYRLEYTPTNQATCLYLNNVKKVCESGLDFYRAFFGIWLSKYSVNKEFTDVLLGKDTTN